MKYKLIIFDLDGTVLDTLDDLADSVNYSLIKNNFPVRSREEIRSFVGNGIRKLVELSVPDNTSVKETDSVFADFRAYYNLHSSDKTCPYDGIIDFLEDLRCKNVKLSVVSNKADNAVRALCDKYFSGLFDFVVGERENIPRKPAPDSLYEVISLCNVKNDEVIYIGDSEVDIQTARNAGLDYIIVDWGFRSREFLEQYCSAEIVSDIKELRRLIF